MKDTKTMEIAGCTISQIIPKGQSPGGRSCHQAFCSRGYFYVIGGLTDVFEPNITVYVMDINKGLWTKSSLNSQIPQIYEHYILRHPSNS